MAPTSIAYAKDITCSEGSNGAGVTNNKEDVAGRETEKSTPSASTAQSPIGGEHEHTKLSNLRLSVILGSLWVRCS